MSLLRSVAGLGIGVLMPFVQVYRAERLFKARRKRIPEWQDRLPPDTEAGREAYAIAAKHEKKFARAFIEATETLLNNKIASEFRKLWEGGAQPDRLMSVFPFFGAEIRPEVWGEFIERLERAYRAVAQEAGDDATEEMNRKFGTNMRFKVEKREDPEVPVTPPNPYTAPWIAERTLKLVKEGISDQQRAVVADIIADNYARGVRAEEAYDEIKNNIGLTEREYGAVAKRRLMHEEAGLPKSEVDRLVSTYRTQLLAKRAMRIARTETMMSQGAARRDTWRVAQDEGILPAVERVWVAVPGACPICTALDGKTSPVEGAYMSTVGPVEGPPAHPNCLPGDATVLASGVSASSKRWFKGNLVVITTALGHKFASTPNHPVLTTSGWRSAHLVHVGDHVVSYIGPERKSSLFDDNHQDVPTVRGQIANLSDDLSLSSSVPVPSSSEDFHGDGMDSDVTIIRTDGLLRPDLKATVRKHRRKLELLLRRVREFFFPGESGFDFAFEGPGRAADGFMRRLCPTHALAFAQASHVDRHRFTRSAAFDIGDSKQSCDNLPADSPGFCERLLTSSRDVVADYVVNVDVQSFSGHVFNLQTLQGFYIAQNIFSHNCGCTETLQRKGKPVRAQPAPLPPVALPPEKRPKPKVPKKPPKKPKPAKGKPIPEKVKPEKRPVAIQPRTGTPIALTNKQQLVDQNARWIKGDERKFRGASKEERAAFMQWNWVHGSGRKMSVRMKEAAAREFGLRGMVYNPRDFRFSDADIDFLRRDMRAIYENTQREFRKRGITKLTVYRGLRSNVQGVGVMESWTTDPDVARRFGDLVLTKEVPVDKIYNYRGSANWVDGIFGNQKEVVVLE